MSRKHCGVNDRGWCRFVRYVDFIIPQYINTKRWYIKTLFQCVDISKVNGWNLYRRHCIQLRKLKMQLTLQFRIAEGFAKAGDPIRITGRPSKRHSNESTPLQK